MSNSQYHTLIYHYLKKYQENPSSRIFAPLAEAYRKAGLIDEAVEIAREGLRSHPHFMGGRVALARALFDKKLYQEVIDELSPIMQDIPDNLVAQRLLADSYLILGQRNEALNAYKMLLYFSPQDAEAAQIVQELEAKAYEQGSLQLRKEPEFVIKQSRVSLRVVGDPLMDGNPSRSEKIRKIELLQGFLQKVERYRTLRDIRRN